MASYSHFLGRKVSVSYRVGDILLPASGTFVGDSGRSIFLEQHVEQRGRRNYFRWEIPYQYIYRIAEVEEPDALAPPAEQNAAVPAAEESSSRLGNTAARAATASASSSLLTLPNRPKTA